MTEEDKGEKVRRLKESKTPRTTWRIIIVIAVVAVVVTGVVAVVYNSPRYSWSAMHRDHDGDGTVDKLDPRPYDPTIFANGVGKLIVSILNDYSTIAYFVIYVNGMQRATPNATAGKFAMASIDVTWLVGPENMTFALNIYATIGGYVDQKTYQGTLVVGNNQNVPVNLTLYEDFEWS